MDFLMDLFGIEAEYEEWEKKSSLPLYISGSYEVSSARLNGVRCIILTPTQELVTLPALKKQIKKIQELDNVPVVLKLSGISFYRKKNMIENRIPFITSKQVYLPFMGTFLADEKENQKEFKKFMFSTQQLVLLYLYGDTEKLYLSEATKLLPFTAMTLSRAVKQLEATGLFCVSKDGVNKVISSDYNHSELFERLKCYLRSPICKTGYIEVKDVTKDMTIAGETALSEETMLNPPGIKTYAVYAKTFNKKILMNELIDPQKQVRLELWEYEPRQFSNSNAADKISLCLSFAESNDERIEEAVEELLGKVW